MMKFERFIDPISFGLRDIFIHRDVIVFTWINDYDSSCYSEFYLILVKIENYNSNEFCGLYFDESKLMKWLKWFD